MGVIGAQELERVRREVDDQQPPARRQQAAASRTARAGSSRKCSTWWITTRSNVSLLERRAVHVALAKVDAADLGPLEVGAGDGEHRVAAVDADCALDAVRPSSCSMRPVPVPTSSTDR